jgi:hypothetical protein
MTERKIWKELTDEETKAEVERLISTRLKISPGLLRDALRQLQYQSDHRFSEVVVSDKPALNLNAEIAKLDRYADYEQMDDYPDLALGFYADDATGAPE